MNDVPAGLPGAPLMRGQLDGKRALIVGGGSGIGRAVTRAFRDEGAQVAVMEIDGSKCSELRSDFREVITVTGDATTWADTRAAVAATVAGFGGIDVLVNCVGLFDFYRGLDSLTEDELDASFDEAFRVNVKSHLISVKVALAELRRSHGSVILTVSTSGFWPGRAGILYASTKFALRGAVIALAHELAPDVRVNGVAPGGTLGTDLRGLNGLGLGDRRLDDTPNRADDLRNRTPLAVALTGDDHAASYVFLASDGARGMTGSFLHPDGGMAVKT